MIKKKRFLIVIVAFVLAACAFGLFACGDKSDGGGGGNDPKVGGTYYYVDNDVTDDNMYIVFKNGVWTDDENESGDYTLSGSNITLYVTLGGEKEEFASGTVSGDDITLDMFGSAVVYRKGEDIDPNKPKEKTLSYALSTDKSYYIVKGIGELTGDIEIPAEWKKKPVKEIAENAFASCGELTAVTVPDSVETIGKKAFYKCSALTDAILGESVEKIAESTFEGCVKLESVTVPASVTGIEKNAFTCCLALKDVRFTGTASDWAQIEFYFDPASRDAEVANPLCDRNSYMVNYTPAYAEHQSRDLYIDNALADEIEIDDASVISAAAFRGYKRLKSVSIGGSVSEICEYAFIDCKELETLTIANGYLESIGKYAFSGCDKLSAAVIPDCVSKIDEYAFNECSQMDFVEIGDGVASVGEGAFMGCSGMATLTLGSSVAEICESAFYGCDLLTSVNIPASAIFIGKDAFFGTELTSATFGNTQGWKVHKGNTLEKVENLDDTANAAALLKNSVLMNPEGYSDYEWEKPTLVYTLSNDGTYYIVSNNGTDCRSTIEIPATYNSKPVKEIKADAFKNCRSLTSVKIPESVTSIGEGAFDGCDGLRSITVADDNPGFLSQSGILYNKVPTEILYVPQGITGSVTIPSGVTSIGNSAFGGRRGLAGVSIPDSATNIGYDAFYGCSKLTSVTIGSGMTSIGDQAFYNCDSLVEVKYTGDIASWCEISGLSQLTSNSRKLYIDGNEITGDLVIPNSVTRIEWGAFRGCSNLTSITIPSSVTNIGEEAFLCGDSLKEIRYTGNIASWCAISGLDNISFNVLYIDGNKIEGDLILPEDITSIGSYVFYRCVGLTSVTIPSSVTNIDEHAFSGKCVLYCEASEKPSGWDDHWCGGRIIWNCKNNDKDKDGYAYTVVDGIMYKLKDGEAIIIDQQGRTSGAVNIPNSITHNNNKYKVMRIEKGAFAGCSGLVSVTVPDSVTFIGQGAFSNCDRLVGLTVAKNNKKFFSSGNCIITKDYIDSNVSSANTLIAGCKTSVIPTDGSVRYIGKGAFVGCTSLASVTIPESVISVGIGYNDDDHPFYGCNSLIIYCEKEEPAKWSQRWNIVGSYNAGHMVDINAPVIWNCKNNDKDEDGYAYTIIDGIMYKLKDGKAEVKTTDRNKINDKIKIPNEIVYKGSRYAVTSIGNYAFGGCESLTSITIPSGVTSIGERAFSYCEKLTKITMPSGVLSIGDRAFWGCRSLTSVTIPDGVTSIGDQVFAGCGDLTITIPKSITSIEIWAFYGCNITRVIYQGTKEQWRAIDGSYYISDYLVICADGLFQ